MPDDTIDKGANKAREPMWKYVVLAIIGIAISIAGIIYFVVKPQDPSNTKRTKTVQDRLADVMIATDSKMDILNVLNRFNHEIQEQRADTVDTTVDQIARIDKVANSLKVLNLDAENNLIRVDLLNFLGKWGEDLKKGINEPDLNVQIRQLSNSYPWLNTLLLLIMLSSI